MFPCNAADRPVQVWAGCRGERIRGGGACAFVQLCVYILKLERTRADGRETERQTERDREG